MFEPNNWFQSGLYQVGLDSSLEKNRKFVSPLADHIKILGVTLDKNLPLNNHDNSVCKSVHYHIRALCHTHSSISNDMAKMVVCSR